MTSVNTGSFQSTGLKTQVGPFHLRKQGLHPPLEQLHRSELQQVVEHPASPLSHGSHIRAIPSLSGHARSHPLVVYRLSNFSFQPLLVLAQVVIALNCVLVSHHFVQSLSSLSVQPLQLAEKVQQFCSPFQKCIMAFLPCFLNLHQVIRILQELFIQW